MKELQIIIQKLKLIELDMKMNRIIEIRIIRMIVSILLKQNFLKIL